MNMFLEYLKGMKDLKKNQEMKEQVVEENLVEEKSGEVAPSKEDETQQIFVETLQKKDIELEFIFRLLEKEWMRSSDKRATLRITVDEYYALKAQVCSYVSGLQLLMGGGLSIKEYMVYNKESYILLRIMKKGQKKVDASMRKNPSADITVALDKEEVECLKTCVGEQFLID